MNWLTKSFGYVVSGMFRLTDPSGWRAWGGSSETNSGKIVTVDNALSLAALWACVRIISETIAGLPLGLYDEDQYGNGVLNKGHPLHNLLRHQPNADMTAFEFWQAMIACLLLWGNGYAEKTVNVLGDVVALTPLMPDRVTMRRDPDGATYFLYNDLFGKQVRLEGDQVFHLKGFTLNGLIGLSPIQYARHSLGSALSTDEAAGRIFANGLRPSALYSVKEYLKKEQRARWNEILAENSGNSNRGGFMLLEGGAEFKALELPPEDAQMLQTREFNVDEVCRWYRVPPWMIGHTTRTTSWGTGLEQQMLGFVSFTLKPYTDAICASIRRSLLPPAQRTGVAVKYDFNDLLRADSVGRAALIGVLAQNGVRTRDELRAMDGLGPMPGGDVLTVQSNLVPLDQIGQVKPGQTPGDFGIHKPAANAPAAKEPADAQ